MMANEFILDDHSNGTYAAFKLSEKSAKKLANWCDMMRIIHDPPEEFHCTVLYYYSTTTTCSC